MPSVATNTVALSLFNQGRKNLIEFCKRVERLSSGSKLVNGADDPSGLAISTSLLSQIRGTMAATHNAQEGMDMLKLADSALNGAQEILCRMRDISLRMSNEATLNHFTSSDPNILISSDERKLFGEMALLGMELKRSLAGIVKAPPDEPVKPSVNFNGKILFDGTYEPENYQYLQIGADNGSQYRTLIDIPSMAALVNTVETGLFPGDYTQADFVTYAREHITEISNDIELVSQVRSEIGVKISTLEKTINDLSTQITNNSEFRSGITDADMAEEMSKLARIQIITKTTDVFAAQVNMDALLVLPLLSAVTSVNTESLSGDVSPKSTMSKAA